MNTTNYIYDIAIQTVVKGKNITFSNDNIKMHADTSYKPLWALGRKIFAIPLSLYTMALQMPWTFIEIIFSLLPCVIGKGFYIQKNTFIFIRHGQCAMGRIVSLFNDRIGAWHINRSNYHRKYYSACAKVYHQGVHKVSVSRSTNSTSRPSSRPTFNSVEDDSSTYSTTNDYFTYTFKNMNSNSQSSFSGYNQSRSRPKPTSTNRRPASSTQKTPFVTPEDLKEDSSKEGVFALKILQTHHKYENEVSKYINQKSVEGKANLKRTLEKWATELLSLHADTPLNKIIRTITHKMLLLHEDKLPKEKASLGSYKEAWRILTNLRDLLKDF